MPDLQRSLPRNSTKLAGRDLALLGALVPFPENRMERVLRENVLDVGDEQFLVLLLVMQADREDRLDFARAARRPRSSSNSWMCASIDVPEAICFCDRRPRDQPAEIAPVHVARGIVVGVEKIGVLRNLRCDTRHPDLQNEGLEEPAGVREMPFRRADVRHRLHDVIFRLERLAQSDSEKSRTWRKRASSRAARAFRGLRRKRLELVQ